MNVPGVGGSGSGGRTTQVTLSEINVTPFVDVMLVLLIVFMVSAPLMQQGVQVDLPKANTGSLDETPEKLLIVVDKNQRISMNGKNLESGALLARLKAVAAVRPDVQVYVQADRSIPYGFIAQVIAEVKKAEITRVGLVTEPTDKEKRL